MSIDEPPTELPDAPPMPPTFRPPDALDAQTGPRGADSCPSLIYSAVMGYRDLELDLYVPSSRTGPVGLVIWIHGGGWLFGSRVSQPDALPKHYPFQWLIASWLSR